MIKQEIVKRLNTAKVEKELKQHAKKDEKVEKSMKSEMKKKKC